MSQASAPAPQALRNAVIRLAGYSQDGIQSIGAFLAQLAGSTAQDVMTYMTIPSTISGGPSIFQVHLGSGKVLHPGDEADTLVAFYQDSYDGHLRSLRDGGICFYDSEQVTELKNELEWQWVDEARAKAPDLSPRDLLRKRFAAMR